jgi:ubiquinone/menaquinone biosynthesis C-methylase UbiE
MPGAADQSWEEIGQRDAYYGVLTYDQYAQENLNQASRDVFFESGQKHLQRVMHIIHENIAADFVPQRALDFGCGVGRILIPMAAQSNEVVGLDVASSMLREAEKNCHEQKLTNVSLVQADDQLSLLEGSFNFIHSYIVFQHIPVRRGEALFEILLDHLAENGVGVIHFVYRRNISRFRRIFQWSRSHLRFFNGLVNVLILKQPWRYPALQMHEYNLANIFELLKKNDCINVHVEFSEHVSPYTTSYGALFFFVKNKRQLFA